MFVSKHVNRNSCPLGNGGYFDGGKGSDSMRGIQRTPRGGVAFKEMVRLKGKEVQAISAT